MRKKVLKRGFCPIPELYRFYLRNTAKASIKRVRGGGVILTIVDFPNGYSVEFVEAIECEGRRVICRIYSNNYEKDILGRGRSPVSHTALDPLPSPLSVFCLVNSTKNYLLLDPDQVERDCVSILSAVQRQRIQETQDPTPERVIPSITREDIQALRDSYQ